MERASIARFNGREAVGLLIFKESGANIQTTLFAGAAGPKILQAMGGGSVGLTTVSATAAILALASDAIPMKIVSISTDPAPLFMLLSSPGIDSVPKLAGKRELEPARARPSARQL